jgi:hypothetical protein
MAEGKQVFDLGDSVTLNFDKDHRHALVSGQGKEEKLRLMLEQAKPRHRAEDSFNPPCFFNFPGKWIQKARSV